MFKKYICIVLGSTGYQRGSRPHCESSHLIHFIHLPINYCFQLSSQCVGVFITERGHHSDDQRDLW